MPTTPSDSSTSQPSPPATTAQPVIIQTTGETENTSSGRSFVFGFLAAVVIGLIGAVAFLMISDRDDDGNIEIDVPAVDVDIDG
jgi:hypothetical protein